MVYIDGGVTAAKGFTAGGIHCGVRKNKNKKDLAIIVCEKSCDAAAVYTQNLVKGAPLLVTARHLADGRAQAVLCNSGNANTCNADGEQKALRMCKTAARAAGVAEQDVIVASTGVIGQPLPVERIEAAESRLAVCLSARGSLDAAEAIMTTDTVAKQAAVEVLLDGKVCRIGGIAKGSGMIHPNMATMLCFITTDADISVSMLDLALRTAVESSFNMLSIDGDTSTNDMVAVMASGLCGNRRIVQQTGDFNAFSEALGEVCSALTRQLAADGEGATKLVECHVFGACDATTARRAAKAVICSSLVKTALFGADANWGRVLCALGYAGANIDVEKVDVDFASDAGQVAVCRRGAGIAFCENQAKRVLSEKTIIIRVSLGDGDEQATAWGCDLTYDYVRINGDYRT